MPDFGAVANLAIGIYDGGGVDERVHGVNGAKGVNGEFGIMSKGVRE